MQTLLPAHESGRLQALSDYQILDTPQEAEFDDFTALAAHICGTPVALISLIDADRQWFKSRVGLDAAETPRDQAFCAHAIRQSGVFTVPDAQADARFADNPLVTGAPDIRFYAGAPLLTDDGHALQALSRQVIARLELRRRFAKRDQAGREMRRSEALKSAILQSALDCIITINQAGQVVEWNPAAQRTFGYRREAVLGRDLADLIVPPALRDAHRRGLAHYLATGEGPVLEKRIEITAMRSDGSELPIELAITPICLEGEAPVFTATLRDISERKQAEEALRQAHDELEAQVEARTTQLSEVNRALGREMEERKRHEENYRCLFQNAVEGIFQSTLAGGYLSANPALARLYGYDSPGEMIAGLASIAHQLYVQPERRAEFMRIMEGTDTLSGFESEVRRADGSIIWISENARAIRDEQGVLLRYEGSVEDITKRKRAEENLRVSHERLQLIMDNIPQYIFWKDTDSVYLGCNHNFARAAGLESPAAIKLKTDLDLPWKVEEALAFRSDDRQVMDSDQSKYHILESQRQADGRDTWVETTKVPLHDAQGRVIGILGTYEDVTERRKAEEKITALNRELIQAYDAPIEGWSRALDCRDHETEGHSRRVTELSLRLARAMGMGEEELVHVRRGALLHDIGKMGVPDHVLLKPGPLDDGEWELMRRHPSLAREMLEPIIFLRPALDIPHCHHEKWDGTGYPQCLQGDQIPLAARLFAVVDVWDALRSDRPYRKAWPKERVLDHIQGLSGTHFDPQAAGAFLALMAECEERPALARAA